MNSPTLQRIARAGPLAAALLLALACTPTVPGARESGSNSMSPASESNQCIGRFRLQVPPPLVVSGRSQRIYQAEVSTAALTGGATAESLWAERLRAAAARTRSGEIPQRFDLDAGVQAVWYDLAGGGRMLEAMKPQAGHVLLVGFKMELPAQERVERATRRVMAGYQPQGTRGFCVGHGTLVTEAGRNEETQLALADPKRRELSIRLSTDTVDSVEAHDALADAEQERRLLVEGGAEVGILRNAKRRAAGLDGVEARLRIRMRGEAPFVRYSWRFAGLARNAAAPQIVLVGSAPDTEQAALEAAWEALLASLQPMPAP